MAPSGVRLPVPLCRPALFAAALLLIAFAMLSQRRIVTLIHLFQLQGLALVGSTVTVAVATGQQHL